MNNHHTGRTIAITAAICFTFFWIASCKKEKAGRLHPVPSTGFDIGRIRDCHNEENRYPSQITSGLLGTWLWVSNSCFWTGDTTFTANKHVLVTFSDAGMYKVFEDGVIESEGTWKLAQSGNNIWSISTSKHSQYLNGYVWLCKDEVVFFSSYIDGCDYYFVRR